MPQKRLEPWSGDPPRVRADMPDSRPGGDSTLITLEDVAGVVLDRAVYRAPDHPDAEQERKLLDVLCREFGIEWRDDWSARELRIRGVPMILHGLAA